VERRERDLPPAHPHVRHADVATAQVAVADDPATAGTVLLHVDEGPQLVGEPEPVCDPQRLDVVDDIGGRVVVVGDPGLEGHLGQAGDRFGGDPRNGCD
jgi:hypothetical protein